jgi:hypothetical protein
MAHLDPKYKIASEKYWRDYWNESCRLARKNKNKGLKSFLKGIVIGSIIGISAITLSQKLYGQDDKTLRSEQGPNSISCLDYKIDVGE